jgi:DNA topoisomerase-1
MAYCKIQKIPGGTQADEKWWENLESKSKGKKWDTMRHNGVLFPEPYKPLPKNVKILYNKKPVSLDSTDTDNPLHITAEEAAVFFAMKIDQDIRTEKPENKKAINDKIFCKNFWSDWKQILGKDHVIKDFKLVDFTPIKDYIVKRSAEKKEEKKAMTAEEKAELKEQKAALTELYGYAVIDGVRLSMSASIQPPGIYMSHADSPLRGRIKKRIQPSDITLNVSKKYVPECKINGKPCKWGEVVEKKDVSWIASYANPLDSKNTNYIYLKREGSHWVCMDDKVKFEKARNLGENIEKVRKGYTADLQNKAGNIRQLATAVYLLDELAIRPGTDKDEKTESDTLGLTTLKCENLKFERGGSVTFDFTGKSGVPFKKTVKVVDSVYKNLKSLCSGKKGTEEVFPDINAISLNGYLKKFLPDLTAKVFRTYKAGSILQSELDKCVPKATDEVHEKKLSFNKANIKVAQALNHKNLAAGDKKVDKVNKKIEELEAKKKAAKTPKQKAAVQKSIDVQEGKLEEASENISTNTSRVNYIDSRIIVAWCKKYDMPIEKIYNKNLLKKFVWAMDTVSTWRF